jgi:arylsulfatase A-like enzyme
VGQSVQPTARDSENVLPALLGQKPEGRAELVEHASVLSLRQGKWKYISPGQGPRMQVLTGTQTGNDPGGQLYDLAADPGETTNVIAANAEQAAAMKARIAEIRGNPTAQ